MKKALITGITGQDGAYLARFLIDKGYEVHGVKRRSSSFNTERIEEIYQDPHLPYTNLFLHYGDLADGLNIAKIIQEVKLFIIKREGYPIKSNTLKMLETKEVIFEISSLNIPNISSSMIRLNNNYSDLPKSLIDIVKKNNLYESNRLVE